MIFGKEKAEWENLKGVFTATEIQPLTKTLNFILNLMPCMIISNIRVLKETMAIQYIVRDVFL